MKNPIALNILGIKTQKDDSSNNFKTFASLGDKLEKLMIRGFELDLGSSLKYSESGVKVARGDDKIGGFIDPNDLRFNLTKSSNGFYFLGALGVSSPSLTSSYDRSGGGAFSVTISFKPQEDGSIRKYHLHKSKGGVFGYIVTDIFGQKNYVNKAKDLHEPKNIVDLLMRTFDKIGCESVKTSIDTYEENVSTFINSNPMHNHNDTTAPISPTANPVNPAPANSLLTNNSPTRTNS